MEWLAENWQTTLIAAWPLLGVIAAATPTPKDNEILKKARGILDLFAFNFGHAKNSKD